MPAPSRRRPNSRCTASRAPSILATSPARPVSTAPGANGISVWPWCKGSCPRVRAHALWRKPNCRGRRRRSRLAPTLSSPGLCSRAAPICAATTKSVRLDSSFDRGPVRTTVKIYELFWADLSHGALSSAFAVLSQLTQVFLDVASLARATLVSIPASMSPQEQTATRISTTYRTSAFGYWLLAVPIVLGNLMFVMFCILLPTLLIPDPSPSERVGVAVVIGHSLTCPRAA